MLLTFLSSLDPSIPGCCYSYGVLPFPLEIILLTYCALYWASYKKVTQTKIFLVFSLSLVCALQSRFLGVHETVHQSLPQYSTR